MTIPDGYQCVEVDDVVRVTEFVKTAIYALLLLDGAVAGDQFDAVSKLPSFPPIQTHSVAADAPPHSVNDKADADNADRTLFLIFISLFLSR
ncbi:MAG: hypothetical protein IJQ65_04075 [Kiritimatiellae bacterium]|nr:hypothetical protein [Kiritimatiellia bacterium]